MAVGDAPSDTELEARLAQLERELGEAQRRELATATILHSIVSAPGDSGSVLDAVAAAVTGLCDASATIIYQLDGDHLLAAAYHTAESVPMFALGEPRLVTRRWVTGRAVADRHTIRVDDLTLPECQQEFPDAGAYQQQHPRRASISTPLFRGDQVIGALSVGRVEPRPFSDRHVTLLETFADQAAIAIENARLFAELGERNRDLTEALEQRTATADILGAISGSLTDARPVFEIIAEHAVRLCGAVVGLVSRYDGELIHLLGIRGLHSDGTEAVRAAFPFRPSDASVTARTVLERAVVHIPDLLADPSYGYQDEVRTGHYRSGLGVPMLRDGQVIGVIFVGGAEPGYFSERQVELLKTFADQAVIAIENVRLFTELQTRTRELARSVEELRALGAVSQAVNSSLDLQQVLTTIVAHADGLSGTETPACSASWSRRAASWPRSAATRASSWPTCPTSCAPR